MANKIILTSSFLSTSLLNTKLLCNFGKYIYFATNSRNSDNSHHNLGIVSKVCKLTHILENIHHIHLFRPDQVTGYKLQSLEKIYIVLMFMSISGYV